MNRSLLLVGMALALGSMQAQPVSQKVNLLDSIRAGEVDYHINPKADFHDAPKDVWTFSKAGELVVSGRGYGYVATKRDYRDYHLVLEFKWGARTWGKREKAARDNGILLHAYGPHGAYADTWMASIEAQIIEGGVGDILVLSPKLADGSTLTTSLSASFVLDRDKEKIWKEGAPRQTVTSGRINWRGRDEDWSDRVGFRGRQDVESPPGDWNRLEVIARGDTLVYYVNGAKVNEAFDCKPSQGKVLLQTEGAEMIVRRYELWPLDQFKEKWSAIEASGGTDIDSVRDGQDKPLTPEQSLAAIELDGDYEAQLVAAEPLVVDPVECTWDAQGRMYVADMRDYPLGPPDPNLPWLSRIQLLRDKDGDGRMDEAVTFADHLDHVQGLLPYDGGLIATTRTQILWLKDNNGDGRADVQRPLIGGFNPRHSQLQVSAPRWGPDGCVHFNNGLDAKEIYPWDAPKETTSVPGSNFKWDPRSGKITPTGGKGQYGGGFDSYGHHFYCSNRNPLMFTVLPHEAMLRNPRAGISDNSENIAPYGAETRVYPLQITHTTADAHAGTNTACCGLGVYRGQLMKELHNQVFVPDPTGQLITRYEVKPEGSSLKAQRIGKRSEFFRSRDEWCRPVNFTTGPDEAIYVCDIYRRWIDHARFFPESFVKTHDIRQGEHHGRIWRIVPKGFKARAIADGRFHAVPESGWGEQPAEHPQRAAMLAAAKLSDPKEIAALLSQYPEDPWMAKMAASVSAGRMGQVLAALKADFFAQASNNRSSTLRLFVAGALADAKGDADADLLAALSLLDKNPGKLTWWKPSILLGLGRWSAGAKGAVGEELAKLNAAVVKAAADASTPLDEKLAILPILAQRSFAQVEPLLEGWLEARQPAALQQGALELLRKYAATQSSALIYRLLERSGPSLRRELVPILTANASTALALFKQMETGRYPKAWVDVETRWRYQRGSGEMTDLARRLFGQSSADRAAVLKTYESAALARGDAARGKQVFSSVCISCHRKDELGVDVGPSLADVKVKPREALLTDILDPNRMFEARWSAYQVETKDGRSLSGLIAEETPDQIVLVMMGGIRETLPRSAITSMKSLDRSLMPLGLEAAITPEQMRDLLSFLTAS